MVLNGKLHTNSTKNRFNTIYSNGKRERKGHAFKLPFVPALLESWTLVVQLEQVEHDYVNILQISMATHASIAQRGEHQIQMDEVPGSTLSGVTFFVLFFFCLCFGFWGFFLFSMQ